LAITAALAAAGCTTAASMAPPVTETVHLRPGDANRFVASRPAAVESYGQASPRQYGELRVPPGKGPFPVAMLIHGGCYVGMGSPQNMGLIADWLKANGVASWNVGYREIGSGGGWTATFDDWAAGLAALSRLAQRYPLDLSRLSVVGHSAGATPAVWLASGSQGDEILVRNLPKVRASVVLDGPIDLAALEGMDERICGQKVLEPLFGGLPAKVPGRYAMIDPRKNASTAKEMVIVNGSFPSPAPDIVAALRQSGVRVEQIAVTEGEHFDMLKPGTADFAAIAPALLRVARGR
jgi:acetyl esterase/lipase